MSLRYSGIKSGVSGFVLLDTGSIAMIACLSHFEIFITYEMTWLWPLNYSTPSHICKILTCELLWFRWAWPLRNSLGWFVQVQFHTNEFDLDQNSCSDQACLADSNDKLMVRDLMTFYSDVLDTSTSNLWKSFCESFKQSLSISLFPFFFLFFCCCWGKQNLSTYQGLRGLQRRVGVLMFYVYSSL